MLESVDRAAQRERFQDFTASAQLDRYRRVQSSRPLSDWEMLDVQRLLTVRERRRARLAATNANRPAHRRTVEA